MADKPIHDKHRMRVKARFRKQGLETFNEHEVLELMLYQSIPRGDTNETAHRLLAQFGSLIDVLEARPEELEAVQGIGEHSATCIHLFHEVAIRYQRDLAMRKQNACQLVTYEAFAEYFIPQFEGVAEERFLAAFLDNASRVLKCEVLGRGSVSRVSVDLADLVRKAYLYKCSTIAIAHNHPNGDIVPSNEDIELTKRIARVLSELDMTLIEHTLVANDKWCSIGKLIWPYGQGGKHA